LNNIATLKSGLEVT